MHRAVIVEVKSVGEDVVLAIGTWHCTLHFETAVLLASWLDECGRDAKYWAGNQKRLLKGVGTLHDASDPHWINAGQPFTPGKVFNVNRDILKKADISVQQSGAMVELIAGTAMATITYACALQISQWIRLRAKESQTRAGDLTRHWSRITSEHQYQYGPKVTHG